jgi:hypothetical protein
MPKSKFQKPLVSLAKFGIESFFPCGIGVARN